MKAILNWTGLDLRDWIEWDGNGNDLKWENAVGRKRRSIKETPRYNRVSK